MTLFIYLPSQVQTEKSVSQTAFSIIDRIVTISNQTSIYAGSSYKIFKDDSNCILVNERSNDKGILTGIFETCKCLSNICSKYDQKTPQRYMYVPCVEPEGGQGVRTLLEKSQKYRIS